jgi:glutamyl-tRNA synthetase
MSNKVRVRFAPSPTGALHLGGVRTVLYNYLFAKHHGGEFILRIEDTDQSRYVPGAEQYIYDCLKWCGLEPDESPTHGGPYAPYRQSERKSIYLQYAQKLVDDGNAYYAFDTAEELEQMRSGHGQYDATKRMHMRNSMALSQDEVKELMDAGTPYVIRIRVPENETLVLDDMIRGRLTFDTNLCDDKVLLKADGMPTYHLAVVVDDYLMKITHAFRGEEWLPSAPVHLLLWKHLGWEGDMPQWAHLPLILKPDGNGKLSKRDGDRLGFPVFPLGWTDPKTNDYTAGYMEIGFLPGAFVNLLAMLGWNAGTEQEIFSLDELVQHFNIDRVHKTGAKFDFEKAKWFNNQYIQRTDAATLTTLAAPFLQEKGVTADADYVTKVITLIKDRCSLLTDIYDQGDFFFKTPETIDTEAIKDKWNDAKSAFFKQWMEGFATIAWNATALEQNFSDATITAGIKKGELMLPLRVMLVGSKHGPGVFQIAELLGMEETGKRINYALGIL